MTFCPIIIANPNVIANRVELGPWNTIQINFLVERLPSILLFKEVATATFFPTLWYESGMKLEGSMKTLVWILVHMKSILLAVGTVLLIVGVLLFGITVVDVFRKKLSPKGRKRVKAKVGTTQKF